MDQIERHAARTMKEEQEAEDEEVENGGLQWVVGGIRRMWMDDAGRYEGTGQDWEDDDDDSGVNQNKRFGTEDTRSVTVNGWLDEIE